MSRWWLPVVLFAFAVPQAAHAQPSDGLSAALALEQAVTHVIEHAEPSVVSVARLRTGPADLSRSDFRGRERGFLSETRDPSDVLPNQFGAGVVIAPVDSDDRLILTTYHVVRGGPIFNKSGSGDGSQLEVWFASERSSRATIYAADPRSDLAVLKLDSTEVKRAPLRPVSWSTSAPVRKGQFVVSLGNPYWIARDGSASASWGIVSNLVRRPAALNWVRGGPPTLVGLGVGLQLEQKLPIGTSGSPVINLNGDLVGIASSLAAIEGYERSGGFAMPIDTRTRWIIESLASGREVEYGFLGLGPSKIYLPDSLAERHGQLSAARVDRVPAGSPAFVGGIRQGDVILKIEGVPIRSDLDLMREATLYPPETVIQLLTVRGTGELTQKVKLGKWPQHPDSEGVIASERRYAPWRGLVVDYPTVRQRIDSDQNQEIPAAVVITEVLTDSPAQAARLQVNEYVTAVNKTPVRTPGEFAEAVKSLKGDVTLRLRPLEGPVLRPGELRDRSVVIKDKAATTP